MRKSDVKPGAEFSAECRIGKVYRYNNGKPFAFVILIGAKFEMEALVSCAPLKHLKLIKKGSFQDAKKKR